MDRFHRHFVVGVVALAAIFFIMLGFWPGKDATQSGRATEPYRRELQRQKEEFLELAPLLATLRETSPATQSELGWFIASVLKEHVRAHVFAEEGFLFPAVDRLAESQKCAMTSFLREEHRIAQRWAQELEDLMGSCLLDQSAFCGRAERLTGLLEAHLEAEAAALLPILDRGMTPTQFQREIGSKMGIE